jgi:hypothetical protein
MRTPRSVRAVFSGVVLTFVLLLSFPPRVAQASGSAVRYEPYESRTPAFGLIKPAGWKVRSESTADSLAIAVDNPTGTAAVQTVFMANSMHADAIAALSAQVKKARTQHPDMQLSNVVACKNRSCITATETYTQGRIPTKAKYYLQSDPQQIVIRSFHAPAEDFERERNTLLEVMTNIRLGRPGSTPVPVKTPQPEDEQPAPVQEPLVSQKAPDGSVAVDVPANWNVQANSGNVMANDPGTGVGVVFNNFRVMPNGNIHLGQPGVIVSPHQSSASFIMPIFQKYGYRDAKVLYSSPNRQVMNHCPGGFGGRCDATDFTMSWISPQGIPCMGGFTVINGQPGANGQWTSTISGAWAPASNYQSYVPMLSRISNTFYANGAYSGYYARNSMSGLPFLQQGPRGRYARSGGMYGSQGNWQTQQRMMRDNSASRWNDSQYGSANWITQMEGGSVYHPGAQNPRGGYPGGMPYDYVMFNGGQSHYSSETMRELNNFEMQQIMMH